MRLSEDAAKARADMLKDKEKAAQEEGERSMTVPRSRPHAEDEAEVASNRPTLVAGLDIGTSKIACLIGRLRPCQSRDALVGRSHAIDVIGISHIQSRGIKAGAVVDAAEAEQSVRQAVALAEQMAGVRVESVLLSVSAGRMHGQLIEASAETRGGTVTPYDLTRAMSTAALHATGEGRTVLHALPVGYSLDGVKGIRDPRGMVAKQFGVEMNVVTADSAVARNLMLVVERCHLQRRGGGGESLCRRAVGPGRRRDRAWRRGDRNGRRNHDHGGLFGRPVRAFGRFCARRQSHHDGFGPRIGRKHCGCRANQDVIWHGSDRRLRRA